ncbi:acyltransferase family protein [Salmonella enterica]|uniref:acyltransferase family protein n=1 Tax=Salmonella enterica TaxID=28901 RepID=UPI00187FED43|nr:acyltransferase [Salmonella enterica]MBE8631429.1 acyltransferase [Salmonella enterica subsp. enterica serovar Bahrenfeld]
MHNTAHYGLKSIQSLRAIACILVILSHYQTFIYLDPENLNSRLHFFDWGASGVDLFFVISGFIMAYTTKNKPNGVTQAVSFLLKRAKRILPAYYFWLLFSFAFGGAMSIFHYPEKLSSLISAITFQPNTPNTPPNYIADDGFYIARWTLNYEIYFYIIFSLSLLFSKNVKLVLCWGIFSALIIPFFFTGHITLSTMGYYFKSVQYMFYTNPIILEFLMGIIACYLCEKISFITANLSLYLLILTVIALIFSLVSNLTSPFNLWTGFIFSLILMLCLKCERILFTQTPRFILAIGDMSYSLYLSHLPIAFIFRKNFPNMFYSLPSQIIMVCIMIIATLILGRLSYKYIEKSLPGSFLFRR